MVLPTHTMFRHALAVIIPGPKVQVGLSYSLAIRSNSSLWGWGENNGTLGDAIFVTVPTRISTATNVLVVASSDLHTGIIRANRGQICMTGANAYGQLGTGNTSNATTFTCGNATIYMNRISPLSYCTGATINVSYDVTAAFPTGNIFYAQLSDSAGNFTAPNNIGSLVSRTSGTIAITIH